jgi:hypothetical protein
MKKLMIPAVALAMFMASCGGVKSDAETICDMMNKMVEAQKSNDKAKIEADCAKKFSFATDWGYVHKFLGGRNY